MTSKLQPKQIDRVLYLVICDDPDLGPCVPEMPIDRMNLVSVIKDIRDRQYGAVMHVIELNTVHRICRDATDDFDAVINP